MQTALYQLNPLLGIHNDVFGDHSHGLVMDSYQNSRLHLHALVRSGDYFSTLATRLDALCAEIDQEDDVIAELERLVKELLYLQDHFEISSK